MRFEWLRMRTRQRTRPHTSFLPPTSYLLTPTCYPLIPRIEWLRKHT